MASPQRATPRALERTRFSTEPARIAADRSKSSALGRTPSKGTTVSKGSRSAKYEQSTQAAAKVRPSLGTTLVQRGVLVSSRVGNCPKSDTDKPIAAPSRAFKSQASAPKSRPHSYHDIHNLDGPSESAPSRARSNSVVSKSAVRSNMFGSTPPRIMTASRKNTRASVATIYSQNDEVEGYEDSGDSDNHGDRGSTLRTPSLTDASSSDRSSYGSAHRTSAIPFNADPFRAEPPLLKRNVFGPLGRRKDSVSNVVSARIGSIGGTEELRSMTSRFQEIEDLLVAGRANQRKMRSGLPPVPPLPPMPSTPAADGAAITASHSAKAAAEAHKLTRGLSSNRRAPVASNSSEQMAPPPRPPQSKSRTDMRASPADDPSSPAKSSTASTEASTVPPIPEAFKHRVSLAVPSLETRSQPASILPTARPMSYDGAGVGERPTELMTKEQWEAAYLPLLLAQERRRLLDDNDEMGKPSDLRSMRSEPELSPAKIAQSDLDRLAGGPDGQDHYTNDLGQGREARRRSRSPIKAHRSSPALSAVELPVPHTPKLRSRLYDQDDDSIDGDSDEGQNSPAQVGTPTQFREAMASTGSFAIEATQPLSPRKRVAVGQGDKRLEENIGEQVQQSFKPLAALSGMAAVSDEPSPKAQLLDLKDESSREDRGLSYETQLQREDSKSSTVSDASKDTSRSTPTLGIRLNDSLTNLAIGDVSTDLMQDDQSLISLYGHSDLSFDAAGQSLYRLLGGNDQSNAGPVRPRPASAHVSRGQHALARPKSQDIKNQTPVSEKPSTATTGSSPSTLAARRARSQSLKLTSSEARSVIGSPAKIRFHDTLAREGTTAPVRAGTITPGILLSKTPVKASSWSQDDTGLDNDPDAIRPLVITPRRRQTSLEADDSTASVLSGRNMSGSFLMDELMDEALLSGPHLGTFSAKTLKASQKALLKDPVSPPVPKRESSLIDHAELARICQVGAPMPARVAPRFSTAQDDAVFAVPPLPRSIPSSTPASRLPSASSNGSVRSRLGGVGLRRPSSGAHAASSRASVSAEAEANSGHRMSRPPVSGGRGGVGVAVAAGSTASSRGPSTERPPSRLSLESNHPYTTGTSRLPTSRSGEMGMRTPVSGSLGGGVGGGLSSPARSVGRVGAGDEGKANGVAVGGGAGVAAGNAYRYHRTHGNAYSNGNGTGYGGSGAGSLPGAVIPLPLPPPTPTSTTSTPRGLGTPSTPRFRAHAHASAHGSGNGGMVGGTPQSSWTTSTTAGSRSTPAGVVVAHGHGHGSEHAPPSPSQPPSQPQPQPRRAVRPNVVGYVGRSAGQSTPAMPATPATPAMPCTPATPCAPTAAAAGTAVRATMGGRATAPLPLPLLVRPRPSLGPRPSATSTGSRLPLSMRGGAGGSGSGGGGGSGSGSGSGSGLPRSRPSGGAIPISPGVPF